MKKILYVLFWIFTLFILRNVWAIEVQEWWMNCSEYYIWNDSWFDNKQKEKENKEKDDKKRNREQMDKYMNENLIDKIIAQNFAWGDSYTLKTSDDKEIVYYKWRVSKKYKEIIDFRKEYDMDLLIWEDWLIKNSMITRISENKEHIFIYAKKENWKYVIAKDFIEGEEFVDLKEFKFDLINENIIYSVEDLNWDEKIYLNNKFIYKRKFKNLKKEIVFSDNWKFIIWDRDEIWNVIINYNWEIIKTNYKDIKELSLSKDGRSYWFLWKKDEDVSLIKDYYPYVFKDWKEILDLTKFISKGDSFSAKKIFFTPDANKLYFLLNTSHYNWINNWFEYKSYFIINDKVVSIPYDDISYTPDNIYFNTEFYYYNNDIFALKVIRVPRSNDWFDSALMYYDFNKNKFILSKFYQDIISVEFSNYWRSISFIGVKKAKDNKIKTIFVNDFKEYQWFLEKYWYLSKNNNYILSKDAYLWLREWGVAWFYNYLQNKWCYFKITSNNDKEIIFNKLDKMYFEIVFMYNFNYEKTEKLYEKLLASMNSKKDNISSENQKLFNEIKEDLEETIRLLKEKINK